MAVPRRARSARPRPLPAGRGGVFIESHPTRVSPLIRGILATPACDSPRYRCHSHPLALVLISHDPRCTSRVLYARSVLDYSSYHSMFKDAPMVEDGLMRVPSGPGLGVEIDPDVIEPA